MLGHEVIALWVVENWEAPRIPKCDKMRLSREVIEGQDVES